SGGWPESPASDATLMMRPNRRLIIPRPTAWHIRNVPVALASMTSCHFSSGISSAQLPLRLCEPLAARRHNGHARAGLPQPFRDLEAQAPRPARDERSATFEG